jgi:hypothetical protein
MGKLFDDRGNRMSPSFSSKNGVRYRFYVSSALLRGRKAEAGSVGRVSATELESAVITALKPHQGPEETNGHDLFGVLERVVIARDQLLLTIASSGATDEDETTAEVRIAWSPKMADPLPTMGRDDVQPGRHNEVLVQSVVRAHAWTQSLRDGTYQSIENLAEAHSLHPKVIRHALRLAFLSPDVTSGILEGRHPPALSLAQIPKLLPLQWSEHRRLLG